MADVKEVGKNVYLIDDELYSIPGSGSVYFLTDDKKALIDAGPATSARVVLQGIRQLGFKEEDVDYIILTHIHLDHGGGAGTLLKDMPRAKVLAHHKAVKHLIDPSKLINSTIEAQGREAMIRNGEVLPIEEHRIVPIYDGDTFSIGEEQVLTLLECPGHAPHELCIYESRNRGIFVGDAVGHYIEGTDIMLPATTPPSFDMALYIQSINRLMTLNASKIYFAHSGTSNQVQEKLESAIRKLQERNNLIAIAAAENQLDGAAGMVANHIRDELEVIKEKNRPLYDYWARVDIPISAIEHVKYYQKKHGL